MQNKRTLKIVLFITITMFIYIQSLLPAGISSEESGYTLSTAGKIMEYFNFLPDFLTEVFIRKTAHFLEYLLWGIALFHFLGIFNFTMEIKRLVMVFAIVIMPLTDETIQLFVEGRSGQISDVWLDMGGALFGLMLALVFHHKKKTEDKS